MLMLKIFQFDEVYLITGFILSLAKCFRIFASLLEICVHCQGGCRKATCSLHVAFEQLL
jgi:hypothetical protein